MYRRYQFEAHRLVKGNSNLTKVNTEDIVIDGTNETEDMGEVTNSREESLKHLNAIAEKVADINGVVVREDAVEDIRYIYKLYGCFENKMSQAELHDFRKEVATIVMETNILQYVTKLIVAYPADVYCTIASYKDTHLLFLSLSLLLFYTRESDALTEAVADTAVTKFCKRLLENCTEDHLAKKLSDILEKILHATISLLHKLSMREANLKQLRQLEFTRLLQPYLKSPDEEISMISMSVLANIVTEDECGIISANVHLVAKLLYYLQKGMEKEARTHEGWSTKKSGKALRNLAKNDGNKQLLWNLNALHTLADMVRTGDEEEQFESVNAIWSLCFDEDIRTDILNDKDCRVINMLHMLQQSTANEDIKDTCTKCLWTLRQNVKTSPETSVPESVNTFPQKPTPDAPKGHIMISYQTLNRPVLLKIKHILEEKQYKVWMDVDKMGGSTLQAMAEGVENSAVVLLCYSRKYKESENTRLEAEYIHEQRKPFIPLKMELGYKPDGWLGLMIGSRYFVEFSGKYKFEDKLVDLFRELNRILEPDAEETNATSPAVGQQILPKPANSNFTTNSQDSKTDGNLITNSELRDKTNESKKHQLKQIKQIRKWNKEEVLNWLNQHSLQNEGLEDLTGEEISFLARVMLEAPDKIYDFLTKDLKVDTLLLKSRLVWALDELSKLK